MLKFWAKMVAVAGVAVGLGGCAAAAVVAGGATGGIIANDERTAGSFVEDETIELKINFQIAEEIGRKANIGVTSYNRRVLLTGQVPDEMTRRQALMIVRGVENVRDVVDEMETSNPSSATARLSDTALTGRVKTTLCGLRHQGFSCLDVKVVTEHGVVYLMGLVSGRQEEIAVNAARRVSGVLQVKTLFERAAVK